TEMDVGCLDADGTLALANFPRRLEFPWQLGQAGIDGGDRWWPGPELPRRLRHGNHGQPVIGSLYAETAGVASATRSAGALLPGLLCRRNPVSIFLQCRRRDLRTVFSCRGHRNSVGLPSDAGAISVLAHLQTYRAAAGASTAADADSVCGGAAYWRALVGAHGAWGFDHGDE